MTAPQHVQTLQQRRAIAAYTEVQRDADAKKGDLQSWHDTPPFLISGFVMLCIAVAIRTWEFYA